MSARKPAKRSPTKAPQKKRRPANVARALEEGAWIIVEEVTRIRKECQENGGLTGIEAEMLWKHLGVLATIEKSVEAAIEKLEGHVGDLSEEELVAILEREIEARKKPKSDEDRMLELERELREVGERVARKRGAFLDALAKSAEAASK